MGRAKHTTDAERVQIYNMFENGISMNQIAKYLNVSRKRIQNCVKKMENQTPTVEKRGKPRKTTAAIRRIITRLVKTDPFLTASRLKSILADTYSVELSISTIQRTLREEKLFGRIARKKPHVSKVNLRKRLHFAKMHIQKNDLWWRNVLWSDESKFNRFNSDGKVYVRRPPNQEYNPKYTLKTVKHGGGSVIVWGCFSWYGVGPIHRIEGIMNAQMYKDIMKNVMLPYATEEMPLIWKFQHDNDPKHTAKIIRTFFQEESMTVLEWPPQSPDLNPIENLWEIVDKKINRSNATNLTELWNQIKIAWYSITSDECKSLVDSMCGRCAEVIKNNGYPTKY